MSLTVAHLIAQLQHLPHDAVVLVPGYETDWDTLSNVEELYVCAKPDILFPGPMIPISEPIARPEEDGAFERCNPDTPGAFLAVALGKAREGR